jgi:hypothetical protein
LSPALADLFAGMAGVEYPTRELFEKALEWQVRRVLRMCRDPRRDQVGLLNDEQVAALAGVLPGRAELFDGIRDLRALGAACNVEQQLDADKRAYRVYRDVAPMLDRSMQLQALHQVVTKPRTVPWAKPDCRCGRGEHDGMVYGFVPLWLDAGTHHLDFGMLSRVGLYGLTADDQGMLRAPAGFPEKGVPDDLAAMMREAHQHNVKVDWVIGRSDWSAFARANKAGKLAVLRTLAANIRARLDGPLQHGNQTLIRMASLGADSGAQAGDGVALYFRGFPSADRDLFNDFVKDLSKDLARMQPKRRVILMVDQDAIGLQEPYSFGNLIGLINRINPLDESDDAAINLDKMLEDIPVLVMLNEPTQGSKKALRGAVQDVLHGTDSMRFLRTLVPVLEYDGHSAQQMADDIVYAGDNYYGIGFWTLPFAEPADTANINTLLAKKFHPSDAHAAGWGRYVSFFCPQRLWLRWVFWISLLMAIGVGGFYFTCRGCNERLDSSGMYFTGTLLLIALPLIALAVLAVSDPLLEPYQPIMVLLFGAGGLVVAGGVTRYYFNKSRRKLP